MCSASKSWFIYLLFWYRLPKTVFFFCSEKSLVEKRKEKKSFYLFNMEAQDGQNTKENETLHGPSWNKVVKGKNYIKTDWTLVLKDEEFP